MSGWGSDELLGGDIRQAAGSTTRTQLAAGGQVWIGLAMVSRIREVGALC